MTKSSAKRSPSEFGRRFASVVKWLGICLIAAFILWTVAMVCDEALEQVFRK